MNKELKTLIVAALENRPSASFSAEDVNSAAINKIMEECGLTADSTARDFRQVEAKAFALVEEAIDEILPAKLQQVMGEFAEIRQFARNAEVVFDIEKVGKNRAKLTIAKGARGGIYRAAKLDNKWFSPETSVQTAAVFVTLEEILLGTMSLGELYNNVLEGFQEIVYKEVFNALASGTPVAGYNRIGHNTITATKSTLHSALDAVMPYVKSYGQPTIFGSYSALSAIYNPLASASGYPNLEDSSDIRNQGFVQVYKGVRCVELPNYLVDNTNASWFYDPRYVFVIPSTAKPVKVALKGQLEIVKNVQATGSEKWEAHKIMGVGLAMANNYAVITVSDATIASVASSY